MAWCHWRMTYTKDWRSRRRLEIMGRISLLRPRIGSTMANISWGEGLGQPGWYFKFSWSGWRISSIKCNTFLIHGLRRSWLSMKSLLLSSSARMDQWGSSPNAKRDGICAQTALCRTMSRMSQSYIGRGNNGGCWVWMASVSGRIYGRAISVYGMWVSVGVSVESRIAIYHGGELRRGFSSTMPCRTLSWSARQV